MIPRSRPAGQPAAAPCLRVRPARLAAWIAGLLLLAITAWMASTALRSYPSFDGAMNLNVASSLARGGGYGFRYDSVFPFPAQTDGPFILPAALLFRMFGISRVTAQAVGVAYLAGFVVLVPVLLRRAGLPPWAAIAAAAACLAMPGASEYGLDGYGEIPMLCWMLAALLAAARAVEQPRPAAGLFVLSGLLFGVSVLTKTVALILVVPAAAACAACAARSPRRGWQEVAALAIGVALPIAGWELFRLMALGSVGAWHLWWRLQLGQIALQSGSAEARLLPGPLLIKLGRHLRILAGEVGVPAPLLAVWLLLPPVAAAGLRHPARPGARLVASALVAATLSGFGWWLLLAPTGMTWLRRALPALLLQTCLVALLLPGGLAGRPRRLLAVLLLLPQLALLGSGLHLLSQPGAGARSDAIRRAVTLMRGLPPDSVFFGVGWWQAPVLSLFSGRTVMNLDRWPAARINALPDKFLLVDRAMREIGGNDLLQVRAVATLQPLLDTPDAAIYRILSVDPERPARDPSPLRSGFDARTDPLAHGGGWYPSAGGWAWVQPHSHVLLARTRQTRLVLDAAFWSELFPPGIVSRHLHVSAPPCLDRDVPLPGAGIRHLALPLDCPPSRAPEPLDVVMVLDAAMPLLHQLDADTRLRGFEVGRLALEP